MKQMFLTMLFCFNLIKSYSQEKYLCKDTIIDLNYLICSNKSVNTNEINDVCEINQLKLFSFDQNLNYGNAIFYFGNNLAIQHNIANFKFTSDEMDSIALKIKNFFLKANSSTEVSKLKKYKINKTKFTSVKKLVDIKIIEAGYGNDLFPDIKKSKLVFKLNKVKRYYIVGLNTY